MTNYKPVLSPNEGRSIQPAIANSEHQQRIVQLYCTYHSVSSLCLALGRKKRTVLAGFVGVSCYLDDILIMGELTKQQHDDQLKTSSGPAG